MLSLIVAHSSNRVIGKNNDLPWHLPEDLKHFKATTMGHAIIMGRKTFESIGRPLPGRRNVVITQNPNWSAEGVDVVHSLDDIVRERSFEDGFIIGGATLYKQALPFVQRLFITLICQEFEGDAFFPEIDYENDFKIISQSEVMLSEKSQLPYQLIEAVRIETSSNKS